MFCICATTSPFSAWTSGGSELGAALEGAEQDIVVHHQCALIGHEVLERVHAVGVHDLAHLARDLVRPGRDCQMVGIVPGSLFGLCRQS